MSHIRKILSIGVSAVLIILCTCACASKKSGILSFKSADATMEINISGEKPNVLDPWQVNIRLRVFDRSITKAIEYYSGTLDYTTVHCAWQGAHSCILTFDQQDDTKRVFAIQGTEDTYTFRDISDDK